MKERADAGAASGFSAALVALYKYRRMRWFVTRVARRLEGGELVSPTMREFLLRYQNVDIGLWTHGFWWIDPASIDPNTTIGRYCSIAEGVRILNHNHPLAFKSTSAMFYNPELGFADRMLVDFSHTEIGNDVWIGANAVVLPEVRSVGDGAVIGAGAVVHRDVPPYAVVLGNPARVVKYRFPQEVISRLLEEKWWEHDPGDLPGGMRAFQTSLLAQLEAEADATRDAEARRLASSQVGRPRVS